MAERPDPPAHGPPEAGLDHAFATADPADRTRCHHVVNYDAGGRPVLCTLARRYHPILEDDTHPRREPPRRADQP